MERNIETLLITRSYIADCVGPAAYLDAIEEAFRAFSGGKLAVPSIGHLPGANGGAFHVKAAAVLGGGARAAIKINGNFPQNPQHHGLPTLQGFIALLDADC